VKVDSCRAAPRRIAPCRVASQLIPPPVHTSLSFSLSLSLFPSPLPAPFFYLSVGLSAKKFAETFSGRKTGNRYPLSETSFLRHELYNRHVVSARDAYVLRKMYPCKFDIKSIISSYYRNIYTYKTVLSSSANIN